MNKLRLLIVSEQNDFDKKLSSTIKKFSSERNLFFTNLYNNSMNMSSITNLNQLSNEKPATKTSSKSIFRGTLLKRCKSSKDVYDRTDRDSKKLKDDHALQRQSFNLDDSDRNYLFSQNRKNIVKELRKNFENLPDNNQNSQQQQQQQQMIISSKPPPGHKKIPTPFQRCEFSANEVEKRLSLREKSVSAENASKRSLSRHSFYLHRTGYEVYDDANDENCDGCARAKIKARHLMDARDTNKPPPMPPRRTTSINYETINDKNNNRNDMDAILIARNNLLNGHMQRRRSLNAAIVRDNNLYRNLLSDSFEDSKLGIKKSGSVNKIDLEILKSELDDYVDPAWRANIKLGYGFRSQRSLGNNRKVRLISSISSLSHHLYLFGSSLRVVRIPKIYYFFKITKE